MQRAGLWSMFIAAILACGLTARFANAAAAAAMLEPGASAPDFTLPSQEDKQVSLSQYKGKWVVLYFYPKDQTPGCTIEAHNFQRDQAMYDKDNAAVLGVSLDTADSHKASQIHSARRKILPSRCWPTRNTRLWMSTACR